MLNKKKKTFQDVTLDYIISGCSLSVSSAYLLVLTVVRSLELFVSVILFMLNSLSGATIW